MLKWQDKEADFRGGGPIKIHLTSIICTHEWKIHEAEIFFVVVIS